MFKFFLVKKMLPKILIKNMKIIKVKSIITFDMIDRSPDFANRNELIV
jgi:hypothetical protein